MPLTLHHGLLSALDLVRLGHQLEAAERVIQRVSSGFIVSSKLVEASNSFQFLVLTAAGIVPTLAQDSTIHSLKRGPAGAAIDSRGPGTRAKVATGTRHRAAKVT